MAPSSPKSSDRPATPLLRLCSRVVGWLADRRVPRVLRKPLYRTYARFTGADLSEVRPPLDGYASLTAFFVRRLVDGARPLDERAGTLVSPVDGRVQAIDRIESDETTLQAKGRAYSVRELLGGIGEDVALAGGTAWTLYLSPRDYHRIHAPCACTLSELTWIRGALYSVRPSVLARRAVLDVNERCALRLDRDGEPPLFLVLVGALNVGRIRVVGVDPQGPLESPRQLARGAEVGRFELGSTIVLIAPPGAAHADGSLAQGDPVRLGTAIGLEGPSGRGASD